MAAKRKYYHASRKLNWKPGDIITPYPAGIGRGVYLTVGPRPHYTLSCNGKGTSLGECRYNTYQVIPLGKVKLGDWDDFICVGPVEVVKCLGQTVLRDGKTSRVPKPRARRPIKDVSPSDLKGRARASDLTGPGKPMSNRKAKRRKK